jgi:hypothetical protein
MYKMAVKDIPTFFCAMCWRPIHKQQKRSNYCAVHDQSLGSAEYKARKRQILTLPKVKAVHIKDVMPTLLKNVKSPQRIDRELEITKLPNEFEDIGIYVSEACSKHFPSLSKTFESISADRFQDFKGWGNAVIRKHDNQRANIICEAWSQICEQLSFSQQRLAFIHMIARLHIEAAEFVSLKKGPPPGSVDRNQPIWDDLLIALDEQKQLGITPKLSQIARNHSVTRQTIHKKWKVLQQKSSVYRKVI